MMAGTPSQMSPQEAGPKVAAMATAIAIRRATVADAPLIYSLVAANLVEGRLLPREPGELVAHAPRFLVAVEEDEVIACGELAPLSDRVAEIRSLVVDPQRRRQGVGRALVGELRRRAGREGFERLCAFSHQPEYFVRMGFSMVPHLWLPEKISTDCRRCPLFRRCGQQAVMTEIARQRARVERAQTPSRGPALPLRRRWHGGRSAGMFAGLKSP